MFSNDWYILICHIDVTTGGVKCQSFPPDFTEHVRGQRLPRINKAYPLYWFMIKCLAAYSKGVVSQEKTRHILFGHRTSDSSETHVTPQSFKLYSSFVLILFWPFRMGKVPDGTRSCERAFRRKWIISTQSFTLYFTLECLFTKVTV